jgi:hypothetical protein
VTKLAKTLALITVMLATGAGAEEKTADPLKFSYTFGEEGDISPYGALQFAYSSTTPPIGTITTNVTSLVLQPGAWFFVADDVAIGGRLLVGFTSQSTSDPASKPTSATTIGVAPAVGYNQWLSRDRLSVFPQACLGISRASVSLGDGSPSLTLTRLTLRFDVPMLVHLKPGFFVGLGPTVSLDLLSRASPDTIASNGDKTSSIGVLSTVGGHF